MQTYFLLLNTHHECATGETRPSVLVVGGSGFSSVTGALCSIHD